MMNADADLGKLIPIWRTRWGAIFDVEIKDKRYIFRALTVKELSGLPDLSDEEEILAVAVLCPETLNYDHLPAGIVTTLAEQIVETSVGNPTSVREELSAAKEKLDQYYVELKVVICAAHPNTDPDTLDEYTIPQLLNKAAFAEEVLKLRSMIARGGEFNLQVNDPTEDTNKPPKRPVMDPLADRLESELTESRKNSRTTPEERYRDKMPIRSNDPIAAKLQVSSITEDF